MELITPDEQKQLQKRLQELLDHRSVISERIAEARELGDLKENAEYHAAREQQGLQEAEIRRLQDRLAHAKVVDHDSAIAKDVVFLGSTVKLRDVSDGEEELFRLVGEATGADTGAVTEVTSNSPMGEALMKARIGEVIAVRGPRGTMKFEIVEIV